MRNLKFLLVLGVLASALTACVSNEKENDFGIGNNLPKSLINNHLLFSPFDEEYSFPVWFNDSIVASNKLHQIVHAIYPHGELHNTVDSSMNLPAKTITYTFRKNGTIEHMNEMIYFDNRPISEVNFRYSALNKAQGFSTVQLDSSFVFEDGKKKKNQNLHPSFYQLKKTEQTYYQYYLKANHSYLYVIHDKKPWGPLKIKRSLNPKPTDRILLGTAHFPEKIYSVRNTIEEFDVTLFKYQKEVIHQIEMGSYPFKKTRTFQYDRRGYCIRYIDSLFSDAEYLSRTVSSFVNNMQFFPIQITHKKENLGGTKNFYFSETFEYVYRK